MDYFAFNAAKAGMPAKPAPINTARTSKSEYSANRQLRAAVRK